MKVTYKTHFKCDTCKAWHLKSGGLVVRTVFDTFDKPKKQVKSRVTGRVCRGCVVFHPAWIQPSHLGNRRGFREADRG